MNYRINESTSICDNGIVFKGRTHDPTHSLRSPQAESRTVTFLLSTSGATVRDSVTVQSHEP